MMQRSQKETFPKQAFCVQFDACHKGVAGATLRGVAGAAEREAGASAAGFLSMMQSLSCESTNRLCSSWMGLSLGSGPDPGPGRPAPTLRST